MLAILEAHSHSRSKFRLGAICSPRLETLPSSDASCCTRSPGESFGASECLPVDSDTGSGPVNALPDNFAPCHKSLDALRDVRDPWFEHAQDETTLSHPIHRTPYGPDSLRRLACFRRLDITRCLAININKTGLRKSISPTFSSFPAAIQTTGSSSLLPYSGQPSIWVLLLRSRHSRLAIVLVDNILDSGHGHWRQAISTPEALSQL